MIVVLADEPTKISSVNARETQSIIEAARLFGCRVYIIPPNFDVCETADNALAYVPQFEQLMLGFWTGFIPTMERYTQIYEAARKKNLHLINTPEEFQQAMEFDKFYPLLHDVTPKSTVVTDLAEVHTAAESLGFPVFVKGAVKSNKDKGWSSVVAYTEDELRDITDAIYANTRRSQGKIILREVVNLRTVADDPNGFPIGREYRAFVYKGQTLAMGFYWDEYADTYPLNGDDRSRIRELLRHVSQRVSTPFISVDLGQLDNSEWIVIEIGDGQFSGLSQIPVLELWNKIKDLML